MYNIQHTTLQQYITTSKQKTSLSSKTTKYLTNNSSLLTNIKPLKIYSTTNLSYNNTTQLININDSKNLIKCYIKITLNNIFVTYIFNSKIKTISLALAIL